MNAIVLSGTQTLQTIEEGCKRLLLKTEEVAVIKNALLARYRIGHPRPVSPPENSRKRITGICITIDQVPMRFVFKDSFLKLETVAQPAPEAA